MAHTLESHFQSHFVAMARKVIMPEIEARITVLYKLGWNALSIHRILADEAIPLSYSYLRCKVLPRLGLCKRGRHRPSDERIMAAMEGIINDPHTDNMSSSAMRTVLATQHNIFASQKRIRRLQRALQPALVARRRTGRLHRRTYISLGSAYCWHVDGYDKLSPFGIGIHGCLDGFSRLIMWLELGTTNRKPEQTCSYFLKAVKMFGLPHTVRTDAGNENTNIIRAQRFLSADLPRINHLPPVIVGSSNHNERIERFWGLLRLQKINFWINHFKGKVANGEMIAWDRIDRHLGFYVYSDLVRQDLKAMQLWHNHHRIRSQKNRTIVTGVPMKMFYYPQDYGCYRHCAQVANPHELRAAEARLTGHVPFDPDFQLVFDSLVEELGLEFPPVNLVGADDIYTSLRAEVRERVRRMRYMRV